MRLVAAYLPTWQQAYASLSELTNMPRITETILNANKGMQQFETEYHLPEQTAAALKPIKNLLKTEIGDIRASSVKEIE